MITAKLKQILTDSSCTLVLYEQAQLANLKTDRSDQFDTIGLILQLDRIKLEVKANAILEHYSELTIEVLQQVRLEDHADLNEVRFQTTLDVCKEIIIRLIADAEFKTILPVNLTKILENKYDANVIGWSMSLDLTYLKNENRNPCL
jgi:hypothetical protein